MYQISNFLDKCRARLLFVCIVIHAVDNVFLILIRCTVVIYVLLKKQKFLNVKKLKKKKSENVTGSILRQKRSEG